MTSTYYLLLKKKERQTGKNYVFDQFLAEKRHGFTMTGFGNNSKLSNLQRNYNSQPPELHSSNLFDGQEPNTKQRKGTNSLNQRVEDILNKPSIAFSTT